MENKIRRCIGHLPSKCQEPIFLSEIFCPLCKLKEVNNNK